MPAIIPLLLSKLLPYIALLATLVAGYLAIRHQGAKAANKRNEAAQEAARKSLEQKIDTAVSKDEAIDQKVEKQIEAIKKIESADPIDGDHFKF